MLEPRIAPMLPRRSMKILVATNGSVGSKAAIRFADRLAAGLRDPELVVVTVGALRRELLGQSDASGDGDGALGPELEKEESQLAQQVLAAAEKDLKKCHRQATFRFIQSRHLAPVAETIAREADREKADLIVVGTDRLAVFATWTLGSVSARLLQVARRPVTVVRVAAAATPGATAARA
jgi:nucleotide-binding universal stress UspA family protein